MSEFIRDKAASDEVQQRQAHSYMFAQDSTGLATDGVLTGLAVTQTGTASGSVVIGSGSGVVQDTVGNGANQFVVNSPLTYDVFTANPMGGTPRNDIVVFDSATHDTTTDSGGLRVIIGTPNAVPTDPTVPTTAVPLARLRHAASATTIPTAKIDDLRVKVSLFGAKPEGKRTYWGAYAIGATGASSVTVTHGAGFTPSTVVVTTSIPGVMVAVDTLTSTTFKMYARVHDGTNYGSAFTLHAFLGE